MTRIAYGVPVPRGVPKDWRANPVPTKDLGPVLRLYLAPEDWGEPVNCVEWRDRFGRTRAYVGHYANGRSALVRIDANGKSKTTFGQVPS